MVNVREEKSGCFTIAAMNGVIKSFTKPVTTAPKAAPMTMPTAISTTLPLSRNCLNPFNIFSSVRSSRPRPQKTRNLNLFGARILSPHRLRWYRHRSVRTRSRRNRYQDAACFRNSAKLCTIRAQAAVRWITALPLRDAECTTRVGAGNESSIAGAGREPLTRFSC